MNHQTLRRRLPQLRWLLASLLLGTIAVAQPAPQTARPRTGAALEDEDGDGAVEGPTIAAGADPYAVIEARMRDARDPTRGPAPPYLAGENGPRALRLDTVLASVARAYPPLLAAKDKVAAADGERLKAAGGFDLLVAAKAGTNVAGKYAEREASVLLEQPTALWGARFYGGYRRGDDFPVYKGAKTTSEAGEAVLGVIVPLLKDGPIDERRLELLRAELAQVAAEAELAQKRLEVAMAAASSYFRWIAAGRDVTVAQTLLTIAEQRDAALTEQVRSGAAAAVTIADNVRLIAVRRVGLIDARRDLAQKSVKLSLYLRDARGRPSVPAGELLPAQFPPLIKPRDEDLKAGLAIAKQRRPELKLFELARRQLEVELRFAENQGAPSLDLGAEVSQDFGAVQRYAPFEGGVSSNKSQVGVSLALKWPVQQRKARGLALKAVAKQRVLLREREFFLDSLTADINAAWIDLQAAHQAAALARDAYWATFRLERAERVAFERGRSDLLTVNLREDKTAESAQKLVKELKSYHEARTAFLALTGQLSIAAR